jgi:hypothetical protein
MRMNCLSCGARLIPLDAYRANDWAACPVCEAGWLKSVTITLKELVVLQCGELLRDKGVPTRNGGA